MPRELTKEDVAGIKDDLMPRGFHVEDWFVDCLIYTLSLREQEIERLRESLVDMIALASGLAEDDSWYADKRNAHERIATAEVALAPPQTGEQT